MTLEPSFINLEDSLAIHKIMIVQFGGATGIRNEGVLESALSAPMNSVAYEGFDDSEADWARLAGIYWFAISQNHPFVDGNKRTAFAVSEAFLLVNGLQYTFTEDDVIVIGLALAAKKLGREELILKIEGSILEADVIQ